MVHITCHLQNNIDNNNNNNIKSSDKTSVKTHYEEDVLRDIDIQDLLFFQKIISETDYLQLEDYISELDLCDEISTSYCHNSVQNENTRTTDKTKIRQKFKRKKDKQCNICFKNFTTRTKLELHLRTHDPSNKPFECGFCSRAFTQKYNLKRHELVHQQEREKPYQCHHCGLRYLQASSLKEHILNKHEEYGEIACKSCDKIMKNPSSYRMHQYFVHKNQNLMYCCCYCGATFKQLSNLKSHESTHESIKSFVCSHCTHTFTSAVGLSIHKLTCNHIEIECFKCKKIFNSKESWQKHEQIHLLDKSDKHESNNKCDLCKKVFHSKSNKSRHIRSVHRATSEV